MVGVVALHLLAQSLKQLSKGWRGEGREGEVQRSTQEAGAATVDSGWRGHCGQRLARGCVWTRARVRWLQAQHPSLLHPSRCFPAGGCSRRGTAGNQVCGERGRNRCFHGQGEHFQGPPLACTAGGSPATNPHRSLGERRLLWECGGQGRPQWDHSLPRLDENQVAIECDP